MVCYRHSLKTNNKKCTNGTDWSPEGNSHVYNLSPYDNGNSAMYLHEDGLSQ